MAGARERAYRGVDCQTLPLFTSGYRWLILATMTGSPPDYYQLLGITSNAEEAEIRAAFAREIKKWHPDVGGNGDDQRARHLIIAREILTDPNQRRAYDASRRGDGIIPSDGFIPPRWIFVCSQGMGEFRTIGEALKRANDGDKIYVLPGIYRESIVRIEKAVELAGQGSADEEVVIESEDDLIYLQADGATLRGLALRTLSARRFAVRANAPRATISACSFSTPDGTGVLVEDGSRLVVEGCSFSECTIGLRTEEAKPVLIANKFNRNTTGVLVRSGCDCIIENNDFVDNQGSAIEMQHDTAGKISRNRMRGGAVGIVVKATSRGSIENNQFFGHTDRTAILKIDGATEVLVHPNQFI